MKNQSLGRGLGALIGDEALRGAETGDTLLKLTDIEPNAAQPRKQFKEAPLEELADSLKIHGILQPLTVRRLPSGYYQIIDGERRWRAARLAGLSELPVRVVDADDRAAAEMALIHNLQREDLAPLEEAHGFQKLMADYGLTQEEAAARVGKSRPAVANALRLLQLPPLVQQLLGDETLSVGHVRALLTLSGKSLQEAAARHAAGARLSVRQTEAYVRRLGAVRRSPPKSVKTNEHIEALQTRLTRRLGRKVRVVHGTRKGRIELEYYGLNDLDALLAALGLDREDSPS